jgi:autotransporter-associated beta strand protein
LDEKHPAIHIRINPDPQNLNSNPTKLILMKPKSRFLNRVQSLFTSISLGIAASAMISNVSAADGTWAGPSTVTPTLTYVSAGIYTSSSTLAVGDTILAKASAAGLANNRVYYVVGASAGNYTLSATPGGAAIASTSTVGATVLTNGVATWDAIAATNTQGGTSWTGNIIASGTDAIAAFGNTISAPVAVKSDVTIGTLSFTSTGNELNLLSTSDGTTTTRGALTFATTSGTPTINVTGTKLFRLGMSDATFGQGKLKLNGTQGLLMNVTNSTGGGSIRIEDVDFSGFTNGGSGVGTLTIQQGIVQTTVGNGLGSGTTALNVIIGNASTNGSLYLPELQLGNNQNITINNLDGTGNARIIGGSRTLTIGAGDGTNTNFAGIIGQGSNGTNSNLSLIKAGTGSQTISGNIVGSGASVTVNSGTLALNGGNTYTGATTINSPSSVSLGANESLGFGGIIGISQPRGNVIVKAGSTLDLNGKSVTEQIDLQGGILKNSSAGGGVNNGLAGVSFTAAGSGLTVGGPVLITGGGGSGAAATAYYGLDATDGSIVTIDNGGSGYTSAPTVTFTGGGGTGMAGTAVLTGDAVTSVIITNAGAGYTATPTISFSGGAGTGAAATIPTDRWKITGIQITSAGSNYGSAPTVAIDSNNDLVIDGLDGTQPTISDRNNGGLLVGGADGTVSTLQDNADLTLVYAYSVAPTTSGRTLQKTGPGTLTLAGANDNAWFQLEVQAGNVLLKKEVAGRAANILTLSGGNASLQPGGANNKQVNTLIINSGTFDLNGQSSTKSTVTSLSGTGGFVTNDGPADSTLYIGDGGGVYSDILTYSGVIKDGAKKTSVTVQGNVASTREVILNGANTYTGNTTVNAGVLTLSSAYLANTSTVSIGANGILNLPHGATDVVGKLTLSSGDQPDGTYGAIDSGAENEIAEITGSGKIQVITPAAGYSTWANDNAGGQTADLDFDLDGVDNGTEYFMGVVTAGFTANPPVVTAGATRTVTWPKDAAFSGSYAVQTSSDLTTWADVTATPAVVDNGTSVVYTFPASSGKLFVRLVVTPN